jgi:hypothetical protein
VAENLDVEVFYLLAYVYFNLMKGEQGISVHYFKHIFVINWVKHCEFVLMVYGAALTGILYEVPLSQNTEIPL